MDERARHARLMALFDTLCVAPTAERASRLAALRDEDAELAETLALMLAGDALDSPVDRPAMETMATAPVLPERYRDLGALGAGGMGEVRRVFDTQLNRALAMKIIGPAALALEDRFLAEARVVAQLQHPNIVPVHALGRLPDGRAYFTMREVQGQTFASALAQRPDDLREHVYTLRQVAQAVAYAHDQGVVHRDLKPGNVMIGAFGDVMVLDWGLARRLEGSRVHPGDAGTITAGGTVMGSPGFMAPEQALGMRELIGPPTDVFALGAMLFYVLAGHPPFGPNPTAALDGPPALDEATPAPLADLCRQALASEPGERPADGAAFARALSAWLTGAADRARALAMLAEASGDRALLAEHRVEAARLQREGNARLAMLDPHAPLEHKRAGWRLLDAGAERAQAADRVETRWVRQVHSALSLAPDLSEAHTLLADYHRARAEAADALGDESEAASQREAVAHHDDGRHARWLAGLADLKVTTEPSGAEVLLWRWETEDRRRVPKRLESLGPTPLRREALPAGDYLLRISHPEAAPVDLPLRMERAGAHALHVPLPTGLPAQTCYVSPGPVQVGGDPRAPDGLAATVIDVPGFVVMRYPVTNAEFIDFLDALVEDGRHEDAARWAPREPIGGSRGSVYTINAAGRFEVGVDAEGAPWALDEPVVQITWYAAVAYCRWMAARSGLPWRLLHELEWEKAARGADRRAFPWGDTFDPAFACTLRSRKDPARTAVTAFPTDESPYGLRGLGGNVRDWCLNVWAAEVREISVEVPEGDALRATRGGAYASLEPMCRAATRFAAPPDQHFNAVGFRMGYSWP